MPGVSSAQNHATPVQISTAHHNRMPARVTFNRRPWAMPYAVHAPKISAHRTQRRRGGSRTGTGSMKCGRNGAAAVLVIGWWSSIDASLHVHPGGAHTPARRRDAVTGRCVSRRFRFVPALNERLGWEERQAAWDEPMEANDEAREPRP